MKLKIDFHVHSQYSRDAFSSPKDIIARAKKAGLDGIAITDHNSAIAQGEVIALGKKRGILVIAGIEVKSREGDILAYGVRESFPRKMPAKDVVDMIHERGGIAVAAHPYSVALHPLCVGSLAKKLPFDAIEAFNSRTYYSNKKAYLAAKSRKLPVIAGSDAHMPEEVGNAYTIVDAKARTEKAVLEAVRTGRTAIVGKKLPVRSAIGWYAKRAVRLIK